MPMSNELTGANINTENESVEDIQATEVQKHCSGVRRAMYGLLIVTASTAVYSQLQPEEFREKKKEISAVMRMSADKILKVDRDIDRDVDNMCNRLMEHGKFDRKHKALSVRLRAEYNIEPYTERDDLLMHIYDAMLDCVEDFSRESTNYNQLYMHYLLTEETRAMPTARGGTLTEGNWRLAVTNFINEHPEKWATLEQEITAAMKDSTSDVEEQLRKSDPALSSPHKSRQADPVGPTFR